VNTRHLGRDCGPTTCTLGIGLVLVLAGGVNPAIAHAVCGSDRPCFDKVYMDGSTTYTLKVQGCEKDVSGTSDCTPWDTTTFTVPMPSFGPPEPEPVAGPPRKVEPQQPSTTCGTACQPGGGVPEVLLPNPGPR
jgi:hypothetical protein